MAVIVTCVVGSVDSIRKLVAASPVKQMTNSTAPTPPNHALTGASGPITLYQPGIGGGPANVLAATTSFMVFHQRSLYAA